MKTISLEIDAELIRDFLAELADAHKDMTDLIERIDLEPENSALVDYLFRIVHSVKSNLRMLGLQRISDIMHRLEDILDSFRQKGRHYIPAFSTLLQQIISEIRDLSARQLNQSTPLEEVEVLYWQVDELASAPPERLPARILELIQLLDPYGDYAPISPAALPELVNPQQAADMALFCELNQQAEFFTPERIGYTARILDLALTLNELAGEPIDQIQLTAAVYLHNLGLLLVPAAMQATAANQPIANSATLIRLSHAWLQRIAGWEDAATILGQHGERLDGSGQPNQLHGAEIGIGGRLLAILTTFIQRIGTRTWDSDRKIIMRAIIELNSEGDSRYDRFWLDHLNRVVKSRMLHQQG
jgi:HPt (histidine-containing phosphotransfer) domain-containing protein